MTIKAIDKLPPRRRSMTRAWRKYIRPKLAAFPNELLRITALRYVLCAVRYAWFVKIMRRLHVYGYGEEVSNRTVAHNRRGMMDFGVERSLRLIRPLVEIEGVRQRAAEMKVLSIGPRTEGEIYNLIAHGFRKRNVSGLDLMSYSPMIQAGDMHKMPFPDGFFDIVVVGWVLNYSDAQAKAAAEMARVLKPGGIVAIGLEWSRRLQQDVTGYTFGTKTLITDIPGILALFPVDRVYFRMDDQDISTEPTGDLSAVFRLA